MFKCHFMCRKEHYPMTHKYNLCFAAPSTQVQDDLLRSPLNIPRVTDTGNEIQ